MSKHNIKAWGASEGSDCIDGGRDVCVSVDGVDGEVTLVIDEINGGWTAAGNSPDHWINGALLASFRDSADFTDICLALKFAAINELS